MIPEKFSVLDQVQDPEQRIILKLRTPKFNGIKYLNDGLKIFQVDYVRSYPVEFEDLP